VRGLTHTVAGVPTAALAEEILLTGDGQVRALICVGGNPMAAWPDQRRTEQALKSLDLLVTLDTEMSGTSRMADYVIAPLMQMETPAMTAGSELIKYFTSGTGIPAPYAQYAPRLIEPPDGSDLTEEWQFFLGLAKRMELELWFVNFFGSGGGRFMESAPIVVALNGESELTTEELFEQMCSTSRIPLDEVRRHPHGNIFDVDVVVEERDPDCTARLDVGNQVLLSGLAEVLAEEFRAKQGDAEFPMRLIPRRHPNFMNSSGITLSALEPRKALQPRLCASRHAGVAGPRVGNGGDGGFAPRSHPLRGRGRRQHAARRYLDAPRLRGISHRRPRLSRPRQQRRQTRPHRHRIRSDHRHAPAGRHPGSDRRGLNSETFEQSGSTERRKPLYHWTGIEDGRSLVQWVPVKIRRFDAPSVAGRPKTSRYPSASETEQSNRSPFVRVTTPPATPTTPRPGSTPDVTTPAPVTAFQVTRATLLTDRPQNPNSGTCGK